MKLRVLILLLILASAATPALADRADRIVALRMQIRESRVLLDQYVLEKQRCDNGREELLRIHAHLVEASCELESRIAELENKVHACNQELEHVRDVAFERYRDRARNERDRERLEERIVRMHERMRQMAERRRDTDERATEVGHRADEREARSAELAGLIETKRSEIHQMISELKGLLAQ